MIDKLLLDTLDNCNMTLLSMIICHTPQVRRLTPFITLPAGLLDNQALRYNTFNTKLVSRLLPLTISVIS
jgi:hypothetical protein